MKDMTRTAVSFEMAGRTLGEIVRHSVRKWTGGVVGKILDGPSGVHIKVRSNGAVCTEVGGVNLLCCGKMVLVDHESKLLMDTSNYIDREACHTIPLNTPIIEVNFAPSFSRLRLVFENKATLTLWANREDGEDNYFYFSSRDGVPSESNEIASVIIGPPPDKQECVLKSGEQPWMRWIKRGMSAVFSPFTGMRL